MAQRVASIFAEIGLETAGFDGNAATVQGAISSLVESIGGLHPAAAIAVAGLQQLVQFMGEAAALADESNRIQANLVATIKSTGAAAGMSVREINAMNEALMKQTGIDDELLTQASAVLLTFRHIGSDAFPRATQAAVDLSAKMGGDLQGAIVMVGKALEDPVSGVSALRRVGVQLSEAQEKQIKDFMAVNDLASAQALIMSELETQVGGTAAAMHDAGNRSEDMRNATENLKEEIGQSMIPVQKAWNQAIAEAANGWGELFKNINANRDIAAEMNKVLLEQGLMTNQMAYDMIQAGQSIEGLSVATEEQMAAAREAAIANWQNRDAVAASGEAAQAAQQDYKDLMNSTLGLATGLQRYKDSIKQLEAERTAAMQSAIEDGTVTEEERANIDRLSESISNQKEQLRTWSKQWVLSMMQAKAAADGAISQEEFDTIFGAAQDMGLIDEDIAAMAKNAVAEMDKLDTKSLEKINSLWQSFLAAPDEVVKTVVWNQEGDVPQNPETGQNGPTMPTASTAQRVVIQNYGTINFPSGMTPYWMDANTLVVM